MNGRGEDRGYDSEYESDPYDGPHYRGDNGSGAGYVDAGHVDAGSPEGDSEPRWGTPYSAGFPPPAPGTEPPAPYLPTTDLYGWGNSSFFDNAETDAGHREIGRRPFG